MITEADFSIDALVTRVKKPDMGAIVIFQGMVRSGGGVTGMKIEAEADKFEEELARLKQEATRRFEIEAVEIVHRKGLLRTGENIVAIIVGARHRKDAFRACEFLIDEIKGSAAVVKEELYE